jgi:DNA-binding NtrC family response regulator
VVPIAVPPLRERREDVAELTKHFVRLAASRMNAPPCELDESAMSLLRDYEWPGNVRELENIVTRACVLHPGKKTSSAALAPWLSDVCERQLACRADAKSGSPDESVRLEDMERQLIEATLERFAGHREKTAKTLGIGVRTLANKLRMYGYGPRTKAFSRAA